MSTPLVNIIVPTYREAENIEPLTRLIDQTMKENNLSYEIILVDDHSNDGIETIVESLQTQYNLKLIVREKKNAVYLTQS